MGEDIVELVEAARAGDVAARDRLAAECLPLVYNVVGRALNAHADVDDVVQETMIRALDGLDRLGDPARFRAWLVTIAMNEVRRRWARRRDTETPGVDFAATPDPAGDFVDATILRLGLTAQQREVAEATRWLDDDDRDLLALWWQESAGRLDRADVAAGLGVSQRHAAVRVQRMKAQLDVARVVVRALAADPRCPGLAGLVSLWDGQPSPLWRKRIARHIRDCDRCSAHTLGLIPAEGLLAGLPLVVPLDGVQPAETARALSPVALRVAAGAIAVTVLSWLLWLLWPSPAQPEPPALAQPPIVTITTTTAATTMATTTTTSASAVTAAVVRPEARLLDSVNARRARAGCKPLRADAKLDAAARGHAEDMVARGYFDHESPEGAHADERIEAAGYESGGWAENLHRRLVDPETVVAQWMDGAIHQDNMLDCQYRDAGVAVLAGPGGPVWVLNLARPA